MKLCLINPPYQGSIRQTFPPLGLLYLASYVRENSNIDVSVIDCVIDNINHKGLESLLRELNPDVVGITTLAMTRFSAVECARIAKAINPQIVTILGGNHATFLAEEILHHYSFVDIVVRGEGEVTLLEALESNFDLSSVKGISYRNDGKVIRNPDRELISNLDMLPFPARDLIPIHKYFKQAEKEPHLRTPITSMMTARGCPYHCVYCTSPRMWKGLRRRSPQNVVDEIIHLQKTYSVKDVYFYDDTFNASKKWLREFKHELKKRDVDIVYRCQARVNTDFETLRLMRETGCYYIEFGIESGSPKILKKIKKRITVTQARNAFSFAKKLGIFRKGYFMVGFPEETLEDIVQTEKLMLSLPLNDFAITMVMVFAGTELSDSFSDNSIWFEKIEDSSSSSSRQPNVPLSESNFSQEVLEKISKRLALKTYAKHLLSFIVMDFCLNNKWKIKNHVYTALKGVLLH